MKKIFNFALYDFANSAFTTIIITFIFATYFAKQIAPNPILGQSYWGWTIGITGFLVAIIGPIAGSFADKKNKIVFFIRCFSLLCIYKKVLVPSSSSNLITVGILFIYIIIISLASHTNTGPVMAEHSKELCRITELICQSYMNIDKVGADIFRINSGSAV